MERKPGQSEIVYQVYPKSFFDTNGDGVGDLPGIIAKLDYLQSLGITAIWLSPVFVSPMKDNGYDIADYYAVDPLFGTNEDLDRLIAEAKTRGLKIIMDLVVNHTSDLNKWFLEAKKSKDNPYRDFYIWRDRPNSLSSVFGGSAWEYEPLSKQYYLHLFAKEQPDLNWANPRLREEIYKMMNYWLDKGIAGFRMDVIEDIGKDPDGLITVNGPRLHEYIHEMNRATFGKRNAITIGECWSADDDSRTLYTDPKREELSMVFQFGHIAAFWDARFGKWKKKPFDLVVAKKILFGHQLAHPQESWNTLFWDNHDLPRAVSDYCDPSFRKPAAKMLFGISAFMSGTPFIYQGDEIGMANAGFASMDEIDDIESKNAYASLLQNGFSIAEAEKMIFATSRDNARIPMQWSDSPNAGFSEGKPWLRPANDYFSWCVSKEEVDLDSVLSFYKKTIALRKEPAYQDLILYGTFEPLLEDDPAVFAYRRRFEGRSLVVVANFSNAINKNVYVPKGRLILSNREGSGNTQTSPYSFAVYEE